MLAIPALTIADGAAMAGTAAGTAPFQVTGDRVSAGSAAASNASKHVLAWGNNGNGQLGDGTTTNADVPVKVKLPKGVKVTQLRAGCFHTVAVTSKDHVLAWGDNGNGQLGNGTTVDSTTPVRVRLPRSTKVTAVRAGCQYSLALTSKGHVLAWGYNGFGQLCNGTSTDSDAPVRVRLPKGSKVQILSAGFNFVFASVSGGGLFVWGANNLGQFGDGTTTGSDTPVGVLLPAGARVKTISASCDDSYALTAKGNVLAWGYNGFGQLGDDGGPAGSDTPVRVDVPSGWRASAVSSGPDANHALAIVHKKS